MPIAVRRSSSSDRPAILALMADARGDELTTAEKTERGFVQGTINGELLARFQKGTGVFVAEEHGELAERFDRAVAFVATANAKSLAVHRHYGMTETATFDYHDREYVVFTFDPAEFARR